MYPIIAPIAPPNTCVNWEILSLNIIPSYTCCPRNNTNTRIKVKGISPSLKPVNDANIINAKTTPLAPQSATVGHIL